MDFASRGCRNYVYKGPVPAHHYEALGRRPPSAAPQRA